MGRIRLGILLCAMVLMSLFTVRASAATFTITMTKNATYGNIITDGDGKTLYRFTPDIINVSSACYNKCAVSWPPLLVDSGNPTAGEGLDGNLLGLITRTDGTRQVTFNGMPLYYFAGDNAAGDVAGQFVRNVWFVVKPNTTTVGGQGVSVQTAQNAKLGTILTDGAGRTLYIFTKDSADKTVCYDGCATAWPPLLVGEKVTPSLNGVSGTLGTIMRNDGNLQVTYDSKPLYYYKTDAQPGDTNGQGLGNVWFVINPAQAPAATAAPAANTPATLPRTGAADQFPIEILAGLAILLLALGFTLQRLQRR